MKKRKKRTTRTVPALLAAILLLAAGLAAQTTDSAEALLRTAMDTADVDGDLSAAITQYQTIVKSFATDRAVVASALLGMGQAYEKLGAPEARATYERVLRDYADQADPVAAARTRLAVLQSGTPQPDSALYTEVLWGEETRCVPTFQGDVSPDGRLMTYIDWCSGGNLAIRDLATGESRQLTHTADMGSGENGGHYAGFSRFSPDGEQVLYGWARSSPVGETGELRLVPVHGDQTDSRTVWSPADGSFAGWLDWFPSGDRVATVVGGPSSSRSIVVVSMVEGVADQVQQVRSIDWAGRAASVRVSPDGRYLAYSRAVSREVQEKDIFLVAVDGSSESGVVQHPADDQLFAWSPDGRYLLFGSDRSGQPGLWAQRIQGAEAVGEPRLLVDIKADGGSVGITRDGTLYYAVDVSRERLKLAEIDIATGTLLRPPVDVTDRFVGANSLGRFSPDGETLAYISQRQTLVIRSLQTGEERNVPHALQRVGSRMSWRPDGESLQVQGSDGRDYGMFDVDVSTGQTRLLDGPGGILTPDGMLLLHRDNRKNRESLYAYRVADGSVHALPGVFRRRERGTSPGRFSLSPDGQWIANNTEFELRLHPVSGGDGEVLSTTDARHPFGRWTTWTPDGTALLVHRKEPEAGEFQWRLWVVPVDGSDPVASELVYEPASGRPLAIHPDGQRIVYEAGGHFAQMWALHNLGLDEPDLP